VPSNKIYNKRELININFDLDESNTQEIVQTNMSVAITDMSVVLPDAYGLDIRSHLLLNSELRGEIEEPNYYFQSNDPNRKKVLDFLMMTQGWRQYLWDESDNIEQKMTYEYETGINIRGTVKNFFNHDKIANAELTLTYKNDNQYGVDELETMNNGRFEFTGYHFKDSTTIMLRAKREKINKKTNKKRVKNPNKNFFIELDTFVPPEVTNKYYAYHETFNGDHSFNHDYLVRSKTARLKSVLPYEGDFVKLDEIKLKYVRDKEKEKFKNRNMIYGAPSIRVDFDEIKPIVQTADFLSSLIGKVPGLIISYNGYVTNVRIMGQGGLKGGAPLFLVNNVIVPDFTGVLASDVSFMDILKGPQAALFGSRASTGVISVYTKRGNESLELEGWDKGNRGSLNFVYPGIYTARKFYEPNYMVENPDHNKPDYRSTLYWNPTIKLNEKGKANISFYAADVSTTYRIELQGITSKGLIIKNEAYVDVK